ncbi:hypothetical protein [Xylophilus rhododendri]|nr:hypothetical protein [Xylophilus rhododendri]
MALLLAALFASPWLGAVHSVFHARPQVVSAAAATEPAADAAAPSALRRLFGDHSHSGDCRLYDQLSHADGLQSLPALPPVLLPPAATLAWHAGECLRRWATLFDARGPPPLA